MSSLSLIILATTLSAIFIIGVMLVVLKIEDHFPDDVSIKEDDVSQIVLKVEPEGTVDLFVDNQTEATEDIDSEPILTEDQYEAAQDIAEWVTGRDYEPGSPTLADDLVEAEDPEVIEIEREES